MVVVASACNSSSTRHAASTTSSTTKAATTTTGAPADGDLANARIKLTKIAILQTPTAFAARSGDDTLYVTEQVGRVRAITHGALVARPVLDLSDTIQSGGERGLLGIVFSPDGTKLYVDYTNLQGDTRVDEYAMHGTKADRASRRQLLAIAQPEPNHNGGQLAFGPDGMLYIGMGDGGQADDQGPGHVVGGNAQSLDVLLGKILRIDPRPSAKRAYSIPPDNPFANGGGRPEIWSYGLRNPWRFSFDRATHALWIGDVGQNQWEEIDFAPGASSRRANFGWNHMEGSHQYIGSVLSGTTAPISEYSHDGGRCAVTGGFVYRGTKIPALAGAYLYADYCDGIIRAFQEKNGAATGNRVLGVHAPQVSSFGQDNNGEVYVVSQSDGVFRIDPS